MYPEITLEPEVQQWLQNWEDDHGIPVRVLNGRWQAQHAFSNSNWTDRQVRGTNWTRQHASSHGLTIVTMAAAAPGSYLDYGALYPNVPVAQVGAETRTFADILFTPPEADFGDNQPIVWSDANGTERVYGEVSDRLVYYYFSLQMVRTSRFDLDHLFANLDDAVDTASAQERMQRMIEQSFDNFMAYMTRDRIDANVGTLRRNVAANEAAIIQNQDQIVENIRQCNLINSQIDAMLTAHNRSAEEWQREYEHIANHAAVETVVFRRNALRITTHPITLRGAAQYEGQTRWLGRFQIDINLSSGINGVIARNLDTPREMRDHPHIPDGRPCFGGNATEFMTLLGNGQFSIFIELLIAWLEQYNPRDEYGRTARLWFEYPDADPRFQENGDTETVGTDTEATTATTAAA